MTMLKMAAAAGTLVLTVAAAPPPGATTCSGCHALPNAATHDVSIYGQDAGKLDASMEAFRSGTRPSTLMGRLMKGFSPDDIQAIAAWIAAQK